MRPQCIQTDNWHHRGLDFTLEYDEGDIEGGLIHAYVYDDWDLLPLFTEADHQAAYEFLRLATDKG